jgi:hypothetical protein
MAIYSVNQNRQFYVVSELVTSAEPAAEGQLKLGKTADGKQIFFKHMGKGGLTRTDLIDVDNICYAKITPAADMQRKLKKAVVTLNEDPVVGQDYTLRVTINNYLAPGDACVLIKSAAVHVTKDDTKETFYKRMAKSLEMNFSREKQAGLPELLKFEGGTDGITVTEVGNQPWRLGILSQEEVKFELTPTTIKNASGEDVIWGTVEYGETTTVVKNGKQVADIEYFCIAERGDMFRNIGYPLNIDVKTMVDPEKEYDMLDLHYFFSDAGVQVHKSEKDLTFVSATASVLTAIKTALTGLGVKFTE